MWKFWGVLLQGNGASICKESVGDSLLRIAAWLVYPML
jgi:hypothetical protein